MFCSDADIETYRKQLKQKYAEIRSQYSDPSAACN